MPSKTGTSLASHLRVGVARLARRLRQEGAAEDTTPSQLTALSTLYHRGPMTPGELAANERVKPPSMTRIVAALEERGLVSREPSADDGRVVRIVVTDAGRRAHEDYQKRRDQWLSLQLAKLSPEDRAVLAKAAGVMDRLVEA
jgi:DNA-binding MarR family transcriptional regulator